MAEDLVEMKGETLVAETSGDQSSADIAKLIEEQTPEVEKSSDDKEEQDPQIEVEQPAQEKTEEVSEPSTENPETDKQQPEKSKEKDPVDFYRQGQLDAIELMRRNAVDDKPSSKVETPKETNEQFIERFANDPQGVLSTLMQTSLEPHKKDMAKLAENRALDSARMYNKDFVRLEPMINKIFKSEPNLGRGLDPLKKLEIGYLVAKGLEQQKNELSNKKKEDGNQAKRLEEKKVVSAMPRGSKKVDIGKTTKPFDKLSSKELGTLINKISGGS